MSVTWKRGCGRMIALGVPVGYSLQQIEDFGLSRDGISCRHTDAHCGVLAQRHLRARMANYMEHELLQFFQLDSSSTTMHNSAGRKKMKLPRTHSL